MSSFLSRLVSWLRGRPDPTERPPVRDDAAPAQPPLPPSEPRGVEPTTERRSREVARPAPAPAIPAPAVPRTAPAELPSAPTEPSKLRLGVDFGSSTTQVAVYLEGRTPQLLRLEDLTDHMPSYYAVDVDGTSRIGAAALNLPEQVHSVKPLLADDVELDGFGHPSRIAYLMLEEVVRRTITRLRGQGLIPAEIDRLEVITNLGCTPRFDLDARVLLRDIAQRAGLTVKLASLIEEPVAAAYEVMLSGLVTDGTILVVDMGGGTLDVAVVRASNGGRTFELYASGGSTYAGDQFTKLILDRLRHEVAERMPGAVFSRADETLAWSRADAAKQALSIRASATVALGGIAGIADDTFEVTRSWFEKAAGKLKVYVMHDVTGIYRQARMILDRGGEHDPAPGTIDFEEKEKGKVRRLTEIPFAEDAAQHIDRVVLVGGATNMPLVRQWLVDALGADRVIEPEVVGIDRSAIVAFGLSRPKPTAMTNLRYPSWGVVARFTGVGGGSEVPVYEPFAPTFRARYGNTVTYRHEFKVPGGSSHVALAFQPIGDGAGTEWPRVPLPAGTPYLTFEMDLFGAIRLTGSGSDDLLSVLPTPPRAPWSPPEGGLPPWIPEWKKADWWTEMPVWDLAHDN